MYILDLKAPERARLDIFERVNSGEPLTRQQMRNALYNGPATAWLKQAAEGTAFQTATDGSLNPRTMRDREAINRFSAFKLLGPEAYSARDMDGFLAKGLLRLAELSPEDRINLRVQFDTAMNINRQLFGQHAFRKSLAIPGLTSPRTVINISLFEVCAVFLSEFPETISEPVQNELRSSIIKLVEDNNFNKHITYSTNSTVAVQGRFSEMQSAILSAVG